MEESWEMGLSEPQKKMYLEVKGILEQQNKKVLEPGDLEHFFIWLFKEFPYISRDLLFDIKPPGYYQECFWNEICDKLRDGRAMEAVRGSLVISEALQEHLYGPITPKAEDHTSPVAETAWRPPQECMTVAVPAEVPALDVPGPLGSARLTADPIPVSESPATRPRVRERRRRRHGCRGPRAARNRRSAWKPALCIRLREPYAGRSGGFHSDTRSRAAPSRAETRPLSKQRGVCGAEPCRAQTRTGAGPCRERRATAARGPDRDVGVGKAAATRDRHPRQTRKHVIGDVLATKVTGTVKWCNVKNNYGFITRDDTGEDLFIHRTAIKRNNPKNYLQSVGDGEVVQFDIVQGKKGLQAANVTGPGGIPVKGSRYAQNYKQYPFQQFPYPQPNFPFYPIPNMNPFLSLPYPQFIPNPFFTPWLPYTVPFPYNSSPMPMGG
ncbi:uncharacterized protein [Aphelocoma coerulescens]|uniref:uncharacterized protein n=1 Tax=Aphelocoma coerulescens TaxID=39617 RepID=UPI003604F92E